MRTCRGWALSYNIIPYEQYNQHFFLECEWAEGLWAAQEHFYLAQGIGG